MSWHENGLCRDHPEIDWVPTDPGSRYKHGLAARRNLDAAAAVCGACPVRGVCLDEALRDNLIGIWGGTSDSGRRRLRRARSSVEYARADLLRRLEREATA